MSIEQNLLLIACEEGRDDMLKKVLGNRKLASSPIRSQPHVMAHHGASREPACNQQPLSSILRGTDGQTYVVNINEPIHMPGKWFGSRLVHVASASGHLACLSRLVDVMGAESDPRDPRGQTPLYLASHFKYEDIVRYLLAHKANPDACNNEGLTPLCKASSKGHLTIVKALLDGGADIHLSGKDRRCPLHLAAAAGHVDVVLELIERGAQGGLDMTDNTHGYTPLHLAASNGYHSVVKLLIQKGADVEVKDRHGDGPLHLAARHNRPEMIKVLVQDGKANPLNRNLKGRTALDEAEASHTRTAACVTLLRSIEEEARGKSDLASMVAMGRGRQKEARSSCPGSIQPWVPPSAPFQMTWERRRQEPIPVTRRKALKDERDSYFAPIFSRA